MKVACIGSRELATPILVQIQELGRLVVERGHSLHTGNAPGADQAFAAGGNSVDPAKVHLHLPWASFERQAIHPGNAVETVGDPWGPVALYEEAAQLHPAWDRLTKAGQRLMARNILIVRGAEVCLAYPNWKKSGGGGTGQGLRYCQKALIPIVDLSVPGGFSRAAAVAERPR